MSDGMCCPDCGETHTEWSQTGRHAVDGPFHAGIVEVHECGRCGSSMEVTRR